MVKNSVFFIHLTYNAQNSKFFSAYMTIYVKSFLQVVIQTALLLSKIFIRDLSKIK